MPQVPSRFLDSRLAVAEEKIEILEQETLRIREFLNELRTDRATMQLLVRQVAELHQRFGEFADKMEEIAKRSALDALRLMSEHRDELGHRRWNLRLGWVGAGAAIGGLLISVLLHYS